MGPEAIHTLLSWINPPPDAEITLEANPEDVTKETVSPFQKIGINRLSLGIQSLDNLLLKRLGRQHTAQKACEAIDATAEAGISNITIDLMYDIPSQTLLSWKQTLAQLPSLPITHLSLYNLTIEPFTLFHKKRSSLTPLLPSSEESLHMLEAAIETLVSIGLGRYEISAFARPGFESRHNTGYWLSRPFLGFGPSAFSDWEGERYRNISDLKKYATLLKSGQSPIDFRERLSPLASLHERLAIQLRLLSGIDQRDFPVDPALYQKLSAEGWLVMEGQKARLSPAGLLFYDRVAEEIILPASG
jgi:oxygen-independent coproporphyrinogen-3 oxidase